MLAGGAGVATHHSRSCTSSADRREQAWEVIPCTPVEQVDAGQAEKDDTDLTHASVLCVDM